MVKNVRHTGIVVADMERALKFYREMLGLNKVVFDGVVEGEVLASVTALPGVRIHVVMLEAADGHRIELLHYLSHPRKPPKRVQSCDIGCSHVSFTVDNLDQLHEQMTAEGVQFNNVPQMDSAGYAKFCYAHDYDGTLVELVQVVSDRNTPYNESASRRT